MTSTPSDVQAKLDLAVKNLKLTTISYAGMVRNNGSDWTKWPTSSPWYIALKQIADARIEVASLTTKTLKAKFTSKE